MSMAWQQFAATVWQIFSESAFWVIASLIVGGLVREFLPSSRFRELLNRRGQGAMLGAILFGALLPICSCGVIPLAISLYRSGVRLGPVMAFAAATPIINPAAVFLSLALLGPQITVAYVILGLTLPYLLGSVAERWGAPAGTEAPATAPDCCGGDGEPGLTPVPAARATTRIADGLRWGFTDLGPTIAFYMTLGVLLAGLIQITVGLLKLGKFIRLVPFPVMLGFVNGLAIVIFLAQLKQFQVPDADGTMTWLTGVPLWTMLALVALTLSLIHI